MSGLKACVAFRVNTGNLYRASQLPAKCCELNFRRQRRSPYCLSHDLQSFWASFPNRAAAYKRNSFCHRCHRNGVKHIDVWHKCNKRKLSFPTRNIVRHAGTSQHSFLQHYEFHTNLRAQWAERSYRAAAGRVRSQGAARIGARAGPPNGTCRQQFCACVRWRHETAGTLAEAA